MGLLNYQQRDTLITILKKLSYDSNPDGVRNVLLGGLPGGLAQSITWTRSAAIDIPILVDTIEGEIWARLPNGDYSIFFIIKNAIGFVRGSQLEIDLQTFLNGLQNPPIAISLPAYQPPKACNFDLTSQIKDCLSKLEPKHGLIGFSIPCDPLDSENFKEQFCDRLIDTLCEANLRAEKKPTMLLDPKFTSVERAIKDIKRYKRLLQIQNVLCPILVPVDDEQRCSAFVVPFWQSLTDEFVGDFAHRLILLLIGCSPVVCPTTNIIHPLAPPSFEEYDLRQWFAPIVRSLPWTGQDEDREEVIEMWKRFALAACQQDNQWRIRYLYEYLNETVRILQKRPSREQFFQELATGS